VINRISKLFGENNHIISPEFLAVFPLDAEDDGSETMIKICRTALHGAENFIGLKFLEVL